MKKIFSYIITYFSVTACVATGVTQVDRLSNQNYGGPTSISSSVNKTYVEITPMQKFLEKAMTSQGIELEAKVEVSKNNENMLNANVDGCVDLSTLANTGEIKLAMDLSIDSDLVDTSFSIGYFAPYAYIYNDAIHAKLETSDTIEGVKDLLKIFAPSLDLNGFKDMTSGISTNELVNELTNLELDNMPDGTLKGVLSIGDLVDVALYLDKDYNLVRAQIEELCVKDFVVSIDAKTNFLQECSLSSPEEKIAFDDYTSLTSIVRNTYDFVNQKQYALLLNASLQKEEDVIALNADTIFDLAKNEYYAKATVDYLDKSLDLEANYSDDNSLLFSVGNKIKGQLSKENITRIKDIISKYLPNDGDFTKIINDTLEKIFTNEEINKLKSITINDALKLFSSVIKNDDVIEIKLNANDYIEGNGEIILDIDVTNEQIKNVKLKNVLLKGYKINLGLEVKKFESMPNLNVDEYPSYEPLIDIYDEVMLLSEETHFGFNVNMHFENKGKQYDINGLVQFALDKENKENNKAYVELLINDSVKEHTLIMDLNNANMYFCYDTDLKGRMQINTLKNMVQQIKTLLEDDDPLLSGITSLIPSEEDLAVLMQILNKDYSSISLDLLKVFNVTSENLCVTFDKSLFGTMEDVSLSVSYNNKKLTDLAITNVNLNGLKMNLSATMGTYDENKHLDLTQNYLDLDALDILLKLGITTMHQEYYHLSGSADVDFGLVGSDMKIGIDVYIHNNNGEPEVRVDLKNIPIINFLGYGNALPASLVANEHSGYKGGLTSTSSDNRNASLYFNNGLVYANRSEDATFKKIFKSDVNEKYEVRKKMSTEDFLNDVFNVMFDAVLGFNSKTMDIINEQLTMQPVEQMQFNKLINEMSYDATNQEFLYNLNMSAITGNDAIKSTVLKINHAVSDDEDHLSAANIAMKIGLSVFTIKINVNLNIVDYGQEFNVETLIYDYINNHKDDEESYVSHTK